MYEHRYEGEKAKYICKCDYCGENMYVGDEGYKIPDNFLICEDCKDDFKITVGEDD